MFLNCSFYLLSSPTFIYSTFWSLSFITHSWPLIFQHSRPCYYTVWVPQFCTFWPQIAFSDPTVWLFYHSYLYIYITCLAFSGPKLGIFLAPNLSHFTMSVSTYSMFCFFWSYILQFYPPNSTNWFLFTTCWRIVFVATIVHVCGEMRPECKTLACTILFVQH